MSGAFVITGTDTGIGKTVVSAMLTLALSATYWKPVQSGTEDETDTACVKRLTGLSDAHFLPERYVFSAPLSPHRSAELDGVTIDPDVLSVPNVDGPLLIEGAGGLMVPLTRQTLFIDVFARWQIPVILCARTGLGTINHTLLSIEALRKRSVPLHGLIFVGPDNADNIATIAGFSGVPILGHLPPLQTIDRDALCAVFDAGFSYGDFA